MLMLHHLNPTLKLLSLLWRVLDISAQGFWVEDLIKAWPDENGETNDPDTYFNWLEKQRRYFAGVVWCGMP